MSNDSIKFFDESEDLEKGKLQNILTAGALGLGLISSSNVQADAGHVSKYINTLKGISGVKVESLNKHPNLNLANHDIQLGKFNINVRAVGGGNSDFSTHRLSMHGPKAEHWTDQDHQDHANATYLFNHLNTNLPKLMQLKRSLKENYETLEKTDGALRSQDGKNSTAKCKECGRMEHYPIKCRDIRDEPDVPYDIEAEDKKFHEEQLRDQEIGRAREAAKKQKIANKKVREHVDSLHEWGEKGGKGAVPKFKKNEDEVSVMSKNLPDWSNWILQKNSEAQTEQLKKSNSVSLSKGAAPAIAPAGAGSSDDSEDKKSPTGKGYSTFTMDHVKEIASMKDHSAAKKRAHEIIDGSAAKPANRAKMKMMVNGSRSSDHLAQGMTNFMLAHPGEGLAVVGRVKKDEDGEEEQLDKAQKSQERAVNKPDASDSKGGISEVGKIVRQVHEFHRQNKGKFLDPIDYHENVVHPLQRAHMRAEQTLSDIKGERAKADKKNIV